MLHNFCLCSVGVYCLMPFKCSGILFLDQSRNQSRAENLSMPSQQRYRQNYLSSNLLHFLHISLLAYF